MLKKITLIFYLLVLTGAYAQVGGESTYQFLNLISSPRQAALGGKTITNYDGDVVGGLFNPASINAEMDNQLALNYSSYLGGISFGTAAYAYTWDRHVQTLHLGMTYVNYGSFDGYDINGVSTGSFSGSEAALSAGYAYQIPSTNFYLGANLKLITSKLEQYNSIGIAADIGAIYINERLDFHMALVVRNFGTQLTSYTDLREKLPLEVSLGLSQTLENLPLRWHLTFENLQRWPIGFENPSRATTDLDGNQTQEKVGFFNEALRHTIIGAELFPDRGFNIRLGYNFRRAEELRLIDQRNFSGLSFGLGVKLNKMKLSFTHARYTGAGNANFFGLQIDLR